MLSFLRYILLILLIFLMWKLVKILNRRSRSKESQKQQNNQSLKPAPETLLRCAHCGTHIPRREAIYSEDGRVFCCQAHKNAVK